MAAKHHITVAEIFEGNTADLEKVRNEEPFTEKKNIEVPFLVKVDGNS